MKSPTKLLDSVEIYKGQRGGIDRHGDGGNREWSNHYCSSFSFQISVEAAWTYY